MHQLVISAIRFFESVFFFQFDQLEEDEDDDDLSDSGPDTIR
jgi:hypothetical protein